MATETFVFNGVNGADGSYLLETDLDTLGHAAKTWSTTKEMLQDFQDRADQEKEFALGAQYNPRKLAEAGWGIIFPAQADSQDVQAIRDALKELLDLRKNEAGERYKEYYEEGRGYRPGESKNDFVTRHGASVGPVDPNFVPYYLLIVGDPQSIPFEFQHELDVDYAVGRIYFETLEEYANYAHSVISARTPGEVRLARQAVFFSVDNADDSATAKSNEMLVTPLEKYVRQISAERDLGWGTRLIEPAQATKSNLAELMGGAATPAFLFTASHGVGWPYNHAKQRQAQGALLCQDWPGPKEWREKELSHDFYFGAGDITSDASLLGLVAFHFACYGAGTPLWDTYAIAKSRTRKALARRAFLSALPGKMLGHPRGGALAVIGHVERAWTYSFKWQDAGAQTEVFKSLLYTLLTGDPVGLALDWMNLRHASIATMLNNEIQEIKYVPSKYDAYKMISLWISNNDARGYAVLGDPAVCLPVAQKGQEALKRGTIKLAEEVHGTLPAVLVPSADTTPTDTRPVQPFQRTPAGGTRSAPVSGSASLLESLVAMNQVLEQEESFGPELQEAKQSLRRVLDSLTISLENLAKNLAEFTQEVTSLDVETYVAENIDEIDLNHIAGSGAKRQAATHISLKGNMQTVVSEKAEELDEVLWGMHKEMLEQARANRAEMIRIASELLVNLLGRTQ